MATKVKHARGDFAISVQRALSGVTRREPPRDYIGASIIGNNCDRALFYVHERVAGVAIEARVLRIFDFGHAIEDLALRWLREAGIYVYAIDPTTNDQFRLVSPLAFLKGHIDGIVSMQPLTPDLFRASQHTPPYWLLEVKSHKDARFFEVADLGVRYAAFTHYAQMTTYLHSCAPTMRRAFVTHTAPQGTLYMAINKDTSEVYLEEITYDEATALRLEQRAHDVTRTSAPPPRLAARPDLSPCKWCDYRIHCFNDQRKVAVPQRKQHATTLHPKSEERISTRAALRNPKWGL